MKLLTAIESFKPPVSFVLQSIIIQQTNRRLFTTANHRMGIGYGDILPTDYICIFHGAKLPNVIRKSSQISGDETYELVGEAAVHGLMHGEVDSWALSSKDIILV
jgi:hypothetical protein